MRERMIAEPMLRLLILGGTTEANALARAIAADPAIAPILSLAGRTENPALPPIPVRIGGFGGVDGLVRYMAETGVRAVVDATHPFAARISANAVAACGQSGRPLVTFTRPAWTAEAADDWTPVPNLKVAASRLGQRPRRVFLTTGRLGLAAFRAAPHHHYLVRTIEPPEPADMPPRAELLKARGPFGSASEMNLIRERGIEVLVTKNSGGMASIGKIVAARALRLPVVMVERPPRPGAVFTDLAAVLAWIAAQRDAP